MSKRKYDLVMADPPWPLKDKLPGKTRGAARQYPLMSIGAIKLYFDQFRSEVAKDAILFMWKLASVPEWLDVCASWGFLPKSEVVWCKLGKDRDVFVADARDENAVVRTGAESMGATRIAPLAFGMGRKVRNCHEVCVIAQRGKGLKRADAGIRSVFFAPLREHSRKPDEIYRIAERMYPQAKRLELFARERRKGWNCVGNEVGKFGGA